MAVSKEEFFAAIAEPLRETVVTVGGRQYRLREMTEDANAEYELSLYDSKGKFVGKNTRKAMIAMMLIDDSGALIVDDVSQLASMGRGLAGSLYAECLKLNRYDDNEAKNMIKNSEGAEG